MTDKHHIFLHLAHMGGSEMRYIEEAFVTNWVAPLGPNVDAFEKSIEHYYGSRHAAVLSSGTAAIHLALIMLGVKAGDEVIVQSFTFCATANPITYLGAKPVFVDSEPDTWNMSPTLLKAAIDDRIATTGLKPKAIIAVDLYGMPAKWDEIEDIASKYGIPLIEDSAEAMGSRYKGKKCGCFGKYGILSFNGNKIITTSGGGALLCDTIEEKQKAVFYSTQAREKAEYYLHKDVGYNYRMSNICAGIGRGQMTVLEDHIAHHKHINKLYKSLLGGVDGITVHENPSEEYDSNFWLTNILLDSDLHVAGEGEAYQATVVACVGGAGNVLHTPDDLHTDCEPNPNVEAMRIFLDKNEIEARPLWKPMHKQPVFANCPAYTNGVSESLFKRGLCLPSGPYVSEDDVRYIVSCIKNALTV